MERFELIQVVGNSCENHLDMNSSDSGYEHMSRLEDSLDYSERPSPGALILLICKLRLLSQEFKGWPLVALHMVTDLPLADAPK